MRGPDRPRAARARRSTFEAELSPALRAAVARLFDARDDPERMRSLFDRNDLPMVSFDDERRYRDANRPARLLFRKSLEEMRALRLEDLAPPGALPHPEHALDELLAEGFATGSYEMGFEDGSRLPIVFWTLAHALDGMNVSVFLPADWSEQELLPAARGGGRRALTERELQVLRLAAEGSSGPRIAQQLGISPTTVKTHFENIYEKLGSPDRAAAVATALRLGLIE
ncbi:MAG TPA: LuxR C-terminal-related transcriptional regulator [Solirubrobacterales bacterium]